MCILLRFLHSGYFSSNTLLPTLVISTSETFPFPSSFSHHTRAAATFLVVIKHTSDKNLSYHSQFVSSKTISTRVTLGCLFVQAILFQSIKPPVLSPYLENNHLIIRTKVENYFQLLFIMDVKIDGRSTRIMSVLTNIKENNNL